MTDTIRNELKNRLTHIDLRLVAIKKEAELLNQEREQIYAIFQTYNNNKDYYKEIAAEELKVSQALVKAKEQPIPQKEYKIVLEDHKPKIPDLVYQWLLSDAPKTFRHKTLIDYVRETMGYYVSEGPVSRALTLMEHRGYIHKESRGLYHNRLVG